MLPITLTDDLVQVLMGDAKAGGVLEVDLPNQTITRPNGVKISFEIEKFRKHCLVNGLDDVGLTLLRESEIGVYEERVVGERPWVFGWGGRENSRTGIEW